MQTKTCPICGLPLPATRDFFYYKAGVGKKLTANCIACDRSRVRNYQRNNPRNNGVGVGNIDPEIMAVRNNCVKEARAKYKAWEKRIKEAFDKHISHVSCEEADSVF